MSSTVTMIKKDAVINIQVSTAFLQRAHEMLASLTAEKTDEEIESFKKLLETNPQELPEEWMEHLLLLSRLIQVIESEAVKQGFTYEQTIDDTTTP